MASKSSLGAMVQGERGGLELCVVSVAAPAPGKAADAAEKRQGVVIARHACYEFAIETF